MPVLESYDSVGAIIAFEQGELGEEESLELFQHLIDTGLAWQLQGSYGRTATALIANGECRAKDETFGDAPEVRVFCKSENVWGDNGAIG